MKLLSILVLLVVVAIALGQIGSTREPRYHGHGGPHNGTFGGGFGRNGIQERRYGGGRGYGHHRSTTAPAVVAGKR